MAEKVVSVSEYWKFLNAKERESVFTKHYLEKTSNFETPPDNALLKTKPFLVVEQEIEEKHEKKFKIYYRNDWGFLAFVVVLNDLLRIITAYPVSKRNQRLHPINLSFPVKNEC